MSGFDAIIAGIDPATIEADARERLEWCATQSPDPETWPILLAQSGNGAPVDAPPVAEPIRRERYRAITRERMARMLGQRKDSRWAGRERGTGAGVFNPAEITPEQAAAVLVIVRRYVARWAGAGARYPLSPEGQDDAVARIVHGIWTRDYSRGTVARGNLAGAVWQACALYRRTAWIGESVFDRKIARRGIHDPLPDWSPGAPCDNPAAIAAAVETAERGLWAPSVVNRGRKQSRRERGGKRMPSVSAADARAVLCGE